MEESLKVMFIIVVMLWAICAGFTNLAKAIKDIKVNIVVLNNENANVKIIKKDEGEE